MSLISFFRNNSPSEKPELWSGLPGSVMRNIEMRFSASKGVREIQVGPRARFRADTSTSIGHSLYVYRCWEYPVTRLFNELVRPETVFFDVGANIGYFSVLAASKCESVYSFEPVPALFKELQANIELNGFGNVDAQQVAISNTNGDVSFYVVEGENTGLSSLVGFSGGNKITVPAVTLDSFIGSRQIPHIDLMKIDVEGAEEQVIEGAQKVFASKTAPDIIFERHPKASSDKLLKNLGYTIYALSHQRTYEAPNLFATKRDQPPAVMRQLKTW